MQGAFGKPQGTVARAHVGQVIMSTGTKLLNEEYVIEALFKAKFKFPWPPEDPYLPRIRDLLSLMQGSLAGRCAAKRRPVDTGQHRIFRGQGHLAEGPGQR